MPKYPAVGGQSGARRAIRARVEIHQSAAEEKSSAGTGECLWAKLEGEAVSVTVHRLPHVTVTVDSEELAAWIAKHGPDNKARLESTAFSTGRDNYGLVGKAGKKAKTVNHFKVGAEIGR